MASERLSDLLAMLADGSGVVTGTSQLCQLAARVTGTSGAGIMLLSDELPRGSLCTTDGVAAYLEDLQYTLGEGPSVDAHARGEAVAEPDLAGDPVLRWPVFGPAAARAGSRAVFGFPVRIGTVRLGALTLTRDRPGMLGEDELTDARAVADVAARTILALQAHALPGDLATELAEGANFHYVVHQAAGMVSVQLGVGVTEALVRLRGHAFLAGRSIDEVSRDVVDRRLRLEASEGP